MGFDIDDLLKLAVIGSLLGGVTSYALSMLLTGFTGGLLLAILALVISGAIIYTAKFTDVDGLKFVEWIALFLAIGGVGSLIGLFVPQVSAYILNVQTFTLTGLGFSILYVFVADAIYDRFL